MDIFDKKTRHRCMSHVHGKDTKPEMIVRRYLFAHGYRYRKNCRRLPGTPDIVMRKYGIVIFIHGCFWHGHEDSHLPKTNTEFWRGKIARNKERDLENHKALKAMGWSVMTIWECQLKPAVREQTLTEMEHLINKRYLELLDDKYAIPKR
jgi:DNA mismatch endonuclease (patch repair protein)